MRVTIIYSWQVFASVAFLILQVEVAKAGVAECTHEDFYCGYLAAKTDYLLFKRVCLPRSSFCNGINDCMHNKIDEIFCDSQDSCPFNWWKCKDGRCIPPKWKCDSHADCKDESDEQGCYLKKNQTITTKTVHTSTTISSKGSDLAKRKLIDWFTGRRKKRNVSNKWGYKLPRIATALFLAERKFFKPGNRTMDEMNYELTIQILEKMAGGGNLKKKDLSLYIHALLVTCLDPRKFYGRDLVSELRSIVDSGKAYFSSYDLLVLCNAGDYMTDKDAEEIIAVFNSPHRPFWTDNQAIAILALACMSSRPGVKVHQQILMDMTQELKRQYRNVAVDSLKTTALVLQALIATQSVQRDFDLETALRVIQNAQRKDGSIGSFLDSYYILPVLANSSLLDVTSKHCKRPTTSKTKAVNTLQGARAKRLVIQFSVWVGNEVDWKTASILTVPANSSLYDVLELRYTRKQLLYNVVDGKPYVSSLMGFQDDVETGLYWFIYVRNTKNNDFTLVEESPVDVKIRPNQELILWYKSEQWNKFPTKLITQR